LVVFVFNDLCAYALPSEQDLEEASLSAAQEVQQVEELLAAKLVQLARAPVQARGQE
tara:strand:- start:7 stop:177 length:171 start_codon:yes stop_codon:yes gene_type:complete